jgi:hypothetical protein
VDLVATAVACAHAACVARQPRGESREANREIEDTHSNLSILRPMYSETRYWYAMQFFARAGYLNSRLCKQPVAPCRALLTA